MEERKKRKQRKEICFVCNGFPQKVCYNGSVDITMDDIWNAPVLVENTRDVIILENPIRIEFCTFFFLLHFRPDVSDWRLMT